MNIGWIVMWRGTNLIKTSTMLDKMRQNYQILTKTVHRIEKKKQKNVHRHSSNDQMKRQEESSHNLSMSQLLICHREPLLSQLFVTKKWFMCFKLIQRLSGVGRPAVIWTSVIVVPPLLAADTMRFWLCDQRSNRMWSFVARYWI